jgi:RHS repeat-associated protein
MSQRHASPARTVLSALARWFRPGSVRDVFASSGSDTYVLDHVVYTAFGVITSESNTTVYNPATGQWTSQDPSGFAAGSSNLYEYVGNDATNATDPSGLESWGSYFARLILGSDDNAELSARVYGAPVPRPAPPPPAPEPTANKSRDLTSSEKALAAVFIHAINPDLTEGQFKSILNTVVDSDKDLFSPVNRLDQFQYLRASVKAKIVSNALKGDAVAITLPPFLNPTRKTSISFKEPPTAFDGNKSKDVLQVSLFAHELQHAAQISRDASGGDKFLSTYLNSYAKNWEDLGFDGGKAYQSIPQEMEAYAVTAAVQTVLGTAEAQALFEQVIANYKDEAAFNLLTTNDNAKKLGQMFNEAYVQEVKKQQNQYEQWKKQARGK